MSRAERRVWQVGALGILGAVIGWIFEPGVFAHAWLAAMVTWSAWPLGSIAIVFVHVLTGGRWGYVLRPGAMAGIATLPLLLLAILPVVFNLSRLYPWTDPEIAAHLKNTWYLNVPFFAWRGVTYLVVWFGLAALAFWGRTLERIAAPGLVLLGFTVTFAAIDTTLSLAPEFSSSIYGMMACSGAGLFAVSVAMLFAGLTVERDMLPVLGQLLLGLVVLWIYLDFMQLLIVWQSDLVTEAPYYRVRMHGLWGAIMGIVAIGHFLLPFAILLFPQMQRSRRAVVGVAGLLVTTEVLRSWWTVLPSVPRGLSWLDFSCVVGLGCVAVGTALWAQRRAVHARGAMLHV